MQPYNGWQNLPTKQSKEILHELSRAKEMQKALLLINAMVINFWWNAIKN